MSIMSEAYNIKDDLTFVYMKQPTKRWTFDQPLLFKWQHNEIYTQYYHFLKNPMNEDKTMQVLNMFAGKNRFDFGEYNDKINVVNVDMSDEFNPDHLMDIGAYILVAKTHGFKFDYFVCDPPYNLRKSREKYNGVFIGSLTKIKDALLSIMNDDAVITSYGYDTVGMSESRGFRKEVIGIICHSGDHNDTLFVTERLINREKGEKYIAKRKVYQNEKSN